MRPPLPLVLDPKAARRLPVVCVPLVARDEAALLAEARQVAAMAPDLVEWRIDFFADLADAQRLCGVAARLRQVLGPVPLLLTRRSVREGGQPLAVGEDAVFALYEALCRAGGFAFADWEMDDDPARLQAVRRMTREAGVQLVLSFHDFQRTPDAASLVRRFERAQALDADVAKIAVMPQSPDDVLALLQATWTASRSLRIPVVSMSMGPLGVLTRVAGWQFGSALTFASGVGASAPGQLPADAVRAAIASLRGAGAAPNS